MAGQAATDAHLLRAGSCGTVPDHAQRVPHLSIRRTHGQPLEGFRDLGVHEFTVRGIRRHGTRKTESQRHALAVRPMVAGVDLENSGRDAGCPQVTGYEGGPGPQPHFYRSVQLVFQVGDRVMAPVVDLLHRLDPLDLGHVGAPGSDPIGVVSQRLPHTDLGTPLDRAPLDEPARRQHPRLFPQCQPQEGQQKLGVAVDLQQLGAWATPRSRKDAAETQDPGCLDVEASCTEAAQRYPAARRVRGAKNHAAHRTRKTRGGELGPRPLWQPGRKQRITIPRTFHLCSASSR